MGESNNPAVPATQKEQIQQVWFAIYHPGMMLDQLRVIKQNQKHFVTYRALAAVGGLFTLLFGSGIITKFIGLW